MSTQYDVVLLVPVSFRVAAINEARARWTAMEQARNDLELSSSTTLIPTSTEKVQSDD